MFDTKCEVPAFSVGDVVCISDSAGAAGLARKLQAKWRGPFRVVERLSTVTFRVKKTRTGEQKVVHANRLRRYRAGAVEEHEAGADEDGGDEGDSVRVGEHIAGRDHRMSDQGRTNELIKLALMEELERTSAPTRDESLPMQRDYPLRSRGPIPRHSLGSAGGLSQRI